MTLFGNPPEPIFERAAIIFRGCAKPRRRLMK